MKPTPFKKIQTVKKIAKTDRKQAVLLGLIELFLKSGRPIGSHTLQENGFETLSSATIRNYFSQLEEQGYLAQAHTSGGRTPTQKAFRLYADLAKENAHLDKAQEDILAGAVAESKVISTMLHKAGETLSELSKCAVFISAPRFDQDYVRDVRLLLLDESTLLSVLISDFGLIHTETIYLDKPVDKVFLHTLEEYFFWRMNKGEKPLFANEAESKAAQRIYNEVMVRHVVGYANFHEADVIRTGLSKLLSYPEFSDAPALAGSLALLEDKTRMQALLVACGKQEDLSCWIGDELKPFTPDSSQCTVIAVPYRIGQTIVGSVALLGPLRLPYKNLFAVAQDFGQKLSEALTQSVYKYKITFRQPSIRAAELDGQKHTLIEAK